MFGYCERTRQGSAVWRLFLVAKFGLQHRGHHRRIQQSSGRQWRNRVRLLLVLQWCSGGKSTSWWKHQGGCCIRRVLYDIPQPIDEPSLAINTQPRATSMITYEVVVSGTKRGRELHVDNCGNTFNMKSRTTETNWQCTVCQKNSSRCPATVVQPRRSECKEVYHCHSHLANPGSATVATVCASVTEKSKETPCQVITSYCEWSFARCDDRCTVPIWCLHQTTLARAANRVWYSSRWDQLFQSTLPLTSMKDTALLDSYEQILQ